MQQSFVLLCFILTALLCGCATSDEGEVDVRRTNVQIDGEAAASIQPLFVAAQTGDAEAFEKDDLISFHLTYGYVADFDETVLSPAELSHLFGRAFGGKIPRVKGEIVIAARAFDFTGQGEGDFRNDSNEDAGRVVFYSDDVLRFQGLNFRNLPVYGPVKYSGSPIALRLEAREIDTNSEEEKALLKSLSSLGSAAYAPISPALSVLDEIGSSFIDAQPTSTRFFRMSMVFDPSSGGNNNHLLLRPGYLVFLKDRTRQGDHAWNELLFCPSEGKLFFNVLDDGTTATCEDSEKELYGDNTYFVMEVAKNIGSAEIEVQQAGYKALIEALQNRDQSIGDALTASSVDLVASVQAERLVSKIRGDIIVAANSADGMKVEERIVAGIEVLTTLATQAELICSNQPEPSDNDSDDSEPERQEALLSRAQLDYLFRLIRREVSSTNEEIRPALLPSGEKGYCQAKPNGDGVYIGSERAAKITVDEVKKVFGINTDG